MPGQPCHSREVAPSQPWPLQPVLISAQEGSHVSRIALFDVFGGTAASLWMELPMAGMGRLQSLTLSLASGLSLLPVTQTGLLLVAWPVSGPASDVLCSQCEGSATAAPGALHVSAVPSYLPSAFLSKMNSMCLLHILHSLQSSASPLLDSLPSSTFWRQCLPAFQHPQPWSEPLLCCLLIAGIIRPLQQTQRAA